MQHVHTIYTQHLTHMQHLYTYNTHINTWVRKIVSLRYRKKKEKEGKILALKIIFLTKVCLDICRYF